MELEIFARSHLDRTIQMVESRLLAWHLIQKSCGHIAAEIQLAVFAPSNRKSAARIEFSENDGVPIRGLRELRLVISFALALANL